MTQLCESVLSRCGVHETVNRPIFFLWMHNIKIRLEFISEDDYSIDRINYFVHREINMITEPNTLLLNATPAFIKDEIKYWDSFLEEQIDKYSKFQSQLIFYFNKSLFLDILLMTNLWANLFEKLRQEFLHKSCPSVCLSLWFFVCCLLS